ncbi:MAG: hypothetical protein AAFQ98_26950, partial [Bacteroidota bacterium]
MNYTGTESEWGIPLRLDYLILKALSTTQPKRDWAGITIEYFTSMKNMVLLLLALGLHSSIQAQKIRFKLTYTGTDAYVGTMDPKWFDVVSLQLMTNNPEDLEDAAGSMQGGRFGTMDFSIEENRLPTEDKLMMRTNNGWYPIEKLRQKGDKLRLTFDWAYRPEVRPIDL